MDLQSLHNYLDDPFSGFDGFAADSLPATPFNLVGDFSSCASDTAANPHQSNETETALDSDTISKESNEMYIADLLKQGTPDGTYRPSNDQDNLASLVRALDLIVSSINDCFKNPNDSEKRRFMMRECTLKMCTQLSLPIYVLDLIRTLSPHVFGSPLTGVFAANDNFTKVLASTQQATDPIFTEYFTQEQMAPTLDPFLPKIDTSLCATNVDLLESTRPSQPNPKPQQSSAAVVTPRELNLMPLVSSQPSLAPVPLDSPLKRRRFPSEVCDAEAK